MFPKLLTGQEERMTAPAVGKDHRDQRRKHHDHTCAGDYAFRQTIKTVLPVLA